MAQNKMHITSYTAAEWLASCGFIFPTNEVELDRFEQLHGNVDPTITGDEVDPQRILKNVSNSTTSYSQEDLKLMQEFDPKCLQLPKHISDKMQTKEKNHFKGNTYVKTWKHESVVKMIRESQNNPYEEIKMRARKKILYALDNGWEGPPFSAIQLAKILGIEIIPNDTILDALTRPLGKDKFRIEYNPFQKPTRMNFSISHEIVHTFFSDCAEAIRHREDQPQENKELEELCNIGASELQLPYVVFPDDANKLHDISLINLVGLAQKYKTSLEALFLQFVQVIDRPCAIMICTFENQNELAISYYKPSSTFKPVIPRDFKIPKDSKAYYCITPGYSQNETVKWNFLDEKYDIFCIGLSPVRKDNRPRVGILIVPNDGREELQHRRIKIDYGDVTKPQGKGLKIIAQVVNTFGALGRGVGKSMQKNFPMLKEALDEWKKKKADFRLGESQLVQVKSDIYVFQMLAQKGLFPKDGKTPLDYEALQRCLAQLRETALRMKADVYMPRIGAGFAKGKWEIIEGLIYAELVNYDINVNIYLWGTQKDDDFKPRATLSLFNEQSTWRKEK